MNLTKMHVTAVFRRTASDVWPIPPNLWVDLDQTKNQGNTGHTYETLRVDFD